MTGGPAPGVRSTATGLLFLSVLFTTPVAALEKWGPFQGQIVDGETGEPIPGAVVMAIWREIAPNPVQTTQNFYDVREAVADANGQFVVPRLQPALLGFRITPPQFHWIAPGFGAPRILVTPPDAEPFVAPTIVKMHSLKALPKHEQLRSPGGSLLLIPEERIRVINLTINRKRSELGLPPLNVMTGVAE